MWYVYILECEDGSFYTGATNDLARRFQKHKNGVGGHYTSTFKAKKIIHSEKYETKSEALKREKQIKEWRREKKVKLIQGFL